MPAVGVEPLTEKLMWGATPLDQLACRILFKRLRYEGDFTPPGSPDVPSLQYPGNAGGMNWGSGAYDPQRGLLIVSDVRMPQTVALKRTDDPKVSLKLENALESYLPEMLATATAIGDGLDRAASAPVAA